MKKLILFLGLVAFNVRAYDFKSDTNITQYAVSDSILILNPKENILCTYLYMDDGVVLASDFVRSNEIDYLYANVYKWMIIAVHLTGAIDIANTVKDEATMNWIRDLIVNYQPKSIHVVNIQTGEIWYGDIDDPDGIREVYEMLGGTGME